MQNAPAPFRAVMTPLACLSALLLTSCSGGDDYHRKETFPVTGRITIDGKEPGSPIQITCHDLGGMDEQQPSISHCMTANDGTFEISTYDQGDGVPAGDYVLTFYWGEMNLISMGYGGDDKLNERYSDPAASQHKFTVLADQSDDVDLGTIALTTE